MIVECIDDNWQKYDSPNTRPYGGPMPIKGMLYEVIAVFVFEKVYYRLFEFPFEYGILIWSAEHFREVDINIEDIKNKTEEPSYAENSNTNIGL
jgi:hypothetical protein